MSKRNLTTKQKLEALELSIQRAHSAVNDLYERMELTKNKLDNTHELAKALHDQNLEQEVIFGRFKLYEDAVLAVLGFVFLSTLLFFFGLGIHTWLK